MNDFSGTRLFDSLTQEGRLHLKEFPDDWEKLSQGFMMGVHFDTKNIKAEEL